MLNPLHISSLSQKYTNTVQLGNIKESNSQSAFGWQIGIYSSFLASLKRLGFQGFAFLIVLFHLVHWLVFIVCFLLLFVCLFLVHEITGTADLCLPLIYITLFVDCFIPHSHFLVELNQSTVSKTS